MTGPPTPLPELRELEALIAAGGSRLDARRAGEVALGSQRLPLWVITLGNPAPDRPGFGVFGGVHGLERIGAEVALAFLRSLVMRLRWDATLERLLEDLRIVVMPLVNPGGLRLGTRANPHGVDLMRNAPVDGEDHLPWLLGGHRISPRLPWYRGPAGAPMQAEAQALCAVVEAELLPRPFSLVVDCHSGFGLHDRLWFPFAHTARPFPHLAELQAFCEILDQSLPQHPYLVEPQSLQYRAHGDLWDHLVLQGERMAAAPVLLPLTLEMGSWLWVKKNPRQLFSRLGLFNPLIGHRQQRVLRRHVAWLDFAARAAASAARWLPQGDERARRHEAALARWYRTSAR
ncbi:zinc carboxypeptidase [Aquincola sp. S2]|uniref:Zinc carboxypeptidase n=1 Tax=Pseudaquabacterium terrae TaxID=2732868 RepID=A0ABX2EL94_9BURK|nr:M14 family zinc carboxypeptidase [Aquabacterium terrae]NRF69337.1 zinc carboxypeptidase [Aquabacterium terrae]